MNSAVLIHEALGSLIERGQCLWSPPIDRFAMSVVFRSVAIEGMSELMSDDNANTTKVHREGKLVVKERRLKLSRSNG